MRKRIFFALFAAVCTMLFSTILYGGHMVRAVGDWLNDTNGIYYNGNIGLNTVPNATDSISLKRATGTRVVQSFKENNVTNSWRVVKTPVGVSDALGDNSMAFLGTNSAGVEKSNLMLRENGLVGINNFSPKSALHIVQDGVSPNYGLTMEKSLVEGGDVFRQHISNGIMYFQALNDSYVLQSNLIVLNHNGDVCLGTGCQ